MRKLIMTAAGLAVGLSLSAAPAALAHEGEVHAADAKAAAQLPIVAGEVTKMDDVSGKLTIKHGAIPNLGMDPMTMVFKVGDPAMLKAVKVGDKINFSAEKVNGQLTLTKVEKAK